MDFIDLDTLIEQRSKQTISEIFRLKGEPYFRKWEKEILHQTSDLKNTIIACGGGTACFYDNMEWMKTHGKTIYIRANEATLFHRLKTEKNKRPLISHMSDIALESFIHTSLMERKRFYEMAEEIFEED